MATEYVTGEQILDHVRKSSPDADDSAWADVCAAAINGAIDYRLTGVEIEPDGDAEAEIIRAALQDGAAAYIGRDAPHGVLSDVIGGDAVRLGSDIIRALEPVLRRYGTVYDETSPRTATGIG